MQVIVDSLLTHYTRAGKGPLVLILPGWADSSKSWGPVQTALAKDFDVIVLDLPGFGDSQAPAKTWGLDEYALFAGEFLAKLEAPSLEAAIGHSNGGAIAIRGVACGHLKPAKLVLLASAGIRHQQQGRKAMLKILTKTGKYVTMPLPKGIKQRLRKQVYTAIGSDMLVAEHMQETFKKVVGDDVQADARQITTPALLVYGDKDGQTPLAYGQTFYGLLTGSTFEIIENAGHFLHLEQPDKVVHEVRKFLQS